MEKYKDKIICPVDLVISDGVSEKNIDISREGVPEKWMALDIGPKTQKLFSDLIEKSGTVFRGPMGKFENEKFAQGSKAILAAMRQ